MEETRDEREEPLLLRSAGAASAAGVPEKIEKTGILFFFLQLKKLVVRTLGTGRYEIFITCDDQ